MILKNLNSHLSKTCSDLEIKLPLSKKSTSINTIIALISFFKKMRYFSISSDLKYERYFFLY